jgi:two-component system, chemotaxis family, chemotaxis protein CheY
MAKSILIADDNHSVRNAVRVYLENAGYNVCGEAVDGAEAIEKARELKPDLVVLDVLMRKMNGVEAASTLHKIMPDVPIVLLTMYPSAGNALDSSPGVAHVISKPDGMRKVVECVQSLLGPA